MFGLFVNFTVVFRQNSTVGDHLHYHTRDFPLMYIDL